LVRGWEFSGSSLQHRRLQAATSHRPIAFALEGLPLDRCVTLNYGIRVHLNLFRISVFDIRGVLHFQADNVVSRDRTVKAFEVKLAN
jgi:hypothetical protein